MEDDEIFIPGQKREQQDEMNTLIDKRDSIVAGCLASNLFTSLYQAGNI